LKYCCRPRLRLRRRPEGVDDNKGSTDPGKADDDDNDENEEEEVQ